MLILIAVLIIGALLLARSPRLECASDVHAYVEEKKPLSALMWTENRLNLI